MLHLRFAAALATSLLATSALGQPKPPPELRSGEMPHLMVERAHKAAFRSDTVEIALAPASETGSRVEYKVDVGAGDALVYSISADLPVISEFHGEAHATKTVVFYREETAMAASHGQFVAPMSGAHGWYLANPHDKPVTVRLKLSGFYKTAPGLLKIQRPQKPTPADPSSRGCWRAPSPRAPLSRRSTPWSSASRRR